MDNVHMANHGSTGIFRRDTIQIIPLLPEHAEAVSKLHIEGIHMGFISSLGLDFVTVLYRAIARCSQSFGYVAICDNEIIGFTAFTSNLNKLYRSILLRCGVKFAHLFLAHHFSRTTFRNAFETLCYPKLYKKTDLPKAEFLSMALAPEVHGRGLATRLLKTGLDECARRGIDTVKTLSAVSIQSANVMFQYYGIPVVKQIKSHGVLSNIYVISTDHFSQKKYLRKKKPENQNLS